MFCVKSHRRLLRAAGAELDPGEPQLCRRGLDPPQQRARHAEAAMVAVNRHAVHLEVASSLLRTAPSSDSSHAARTDLHHVGGRAHHPALDGRHVEAGEVAPPRPVLQPRVPHVRGEGVAGVVPVGVVEGGHHHQLDQQLGREQLGAGPQQLAQQAQLQQLQEAGHRGLGGEGSPVGAAPVLQDPAAEYLAHLVMVSTLVIPDTDNIFVLVCHLNSLAVWKRVRNTTVY